MNLFLSRIGKALLNTLIALIVLMLMVLCFVFVGGLIFWLPTWLLSKVNMTLPIVYIVSVLFGGLFMAEWKNIKFWFHWQFIEPFKKKKVLCLKSQYGFVEGKSYKLLGSSGETIQLKDDYGNTVMVNEANFIWEGK